MNAKELYEGQPVKVIDPDARGKSQRVFEGEVTKVARKNVTVILKDRTYEQAVQFKIESQSQETGYGHGGYYFRTLQQFEDAERRSAASNVIQAALNGYGWSSKMDLVLMEKIAALLLRQDEPNER